MPSRWRADARCSDQPAGRAVRRLAQRVLPEALTPEPLTPEALALVVQHAEDRGDHRSELGDVLLAELLAAAVGREAVRCQATEARRRAEHLAAMLLAGTR